MDNAIRRDNDQTNSFLIIELEAKLKRYARVPHYVLITGERGTGKTTIARRLHNESTRSKGEFVNVNCAGLSSELLESELFGYEKGAFTGAGSAKPGLFEIAAGGTLFLDEIGEVALPLQAKLLKAVEEKRIRRVGSTVERRVDVRIVAATSRDLRGMVSDGQFRPDLFDRLNILHIETVPLRYQREKIRKLICTQLEKELGAIGREVSFMIADDAIAEIESREWHGNFRELLNFATRLAVECIDDEEITREAVMTVFRYLPKPVFRSGPNDGYLSAVSGRSDSSGIPDRELVTVTFDADGIDLDSIYVKAAGTMIKHTLKQNNGNLRRAARAMGATHSTLSRILKKFHASQVTEKKLHEDTGADTRFAIAA